MANVKKIAVIGAGLAVLGAFWKKAQADVIIDQPTSVHEFEIIADETIAGEAKRWLVEAVRKRIGEKIPIAGIVTNVKHNLYENITGRYEQWIVIYKYDSDLSAKLLGMVETGLDDDYFYVRKVDQEHYQAMVGHEDVGIFHINRRKHHDIDWSYFSLSDYMRQATIVIDELKGGRRIGQIVGETLHQWGKLPDEATPEASEYFSLALYDRLWNRKASPGSRNARNFIRKYRRVIGEANQLKEITITYTIRR